MWGMPRNAAANIYKAFIRSKSFSFNMHAFSKNSYFCTQIA